jgi:hypothetical protein
MATVQIRPTGIWNFPIVRTAYSRQAKDHYHFMRAQTGNSDTALPERDARMPACGTEGGGSVVLRPCGIEVSALEEASLEQRD